MHVADDVPLLRSLEASQRLVMTPAQAYDDSYCRAFARAHGGCVLSNDLYRDQAELATRRGHSDGEVRAMNAWLRTHVISFTFLGDELLPNPDFVFPVG